MSLGAFNSSLQHEQGASNHEQPGHKERASIGDVQVSKQAGRTARHMGHLLEWSMLRAKQARQKVWPQGVVTGSNSSFKHKMQSVSSQLTTFLQHIAQGIGSGSVRDVQLHSIPVQGRCWEGLQRVPSWVLSKRPKFPSFMQGCARSYYFKPSHALRNTGTLLRAAQILDRPMLTWRGGRMTRMASG